MFRVDSEKHVIAEILEKKERWEKLTEREPRDARLFLYATVVGRSFAAVAVRIDTEREAPP